MGVVVATDSTASLPKQVADQHGIGVIPLNVIIDGEVYRDGIDITPGEVYSRQQYADKLPTTSAPSPGAFLEFYRDLGQRAESILVVTISTKLSMMFNSAVEAKEMVKEELPHLSIDVLDCGNAAGAQGLVTLAAARAAAAGATLSQVADAAKRIMSKVHLLAIIDTLYYLVKGGRAPKLAAWASSILKIKPILTIIDGEVKMATVTRTKPRAKERVLAMMRERAGVKQPMHAIVMHANALEEASEFKERVLSEFNCVEVYINDFTPVMGVHTGPGLVGIAFYAGD